MKENNIKDKRFIELETSIKKDYVREFWYGCKGQTVTVDMFYYI